MVVILYIVLLNFFITICLCCQEKNKFSNGISRFCLQENAHRAMVLEMFYPGRRNFTISLMKGLTLYFPVTIKNRLG